MLRAIHTELRHPHELAGVAEASEALRDLCSRPEETRILVRLEDEPFELRAARMVEHALADASIKNVSVLTRSERHDDTAGIDVVISDRVSRQLPSARLTIILGPVAGQQALLDGQLIAVDAEGLYALVSSRLFRLLQALTIEPPKPLFDEYVMVDVETTSVDAATCRVVEVGGIKVRNGEVVGQFDELVELPPDLTNDEERVLEQICGLTTDDFDSAKPESVVWRQFCEFTNGLPLVAHNGNLFDFIVLERLARKYRAEVSVTWPLLHDLLPAARTLFPGRRSYRMEDLRQDLLKDDRPTAHRALDDCADQNAMFEYMQSVRARIQSKVTFEWLLPLVAVEAAASDVVIRDHEEQRFVQAGYVHMMRGRHEFVDWLRGQGQANELENRGEPRSCRAHARPTGCVRGGSGFVRRCGARFSFL